MIENALWMEIEPKFGIISCSGKSRNESYIKENSITLMLLAYYISVTSVLY